MANYEHKKQIIGTLPVLPVKDIASTLEYYTTTLKFTELFRQPNEEGILVNGQVEFEGCHLILNLNPEKAPYAGGGVYFWIRIDNIDINDYYASLMSKKINLVEEIDDRFWGDRSFTIQDINGYHLAFTKAI